MGLIGKIRKRIASVLGVDLSDLRLDISDNFKWGDLSTPILIDRDFSDSKSKDLVSKLESSGFVKKVELKGPGFLNVFLTDEGLEKIIADADKESRGLQNKEGKERIQVEFISANPTGPLTLGNARGAFGGDCLANIYEFLGDEVIREYYVNNMGRQIKILADSVLAAQNKGPKKYKKSDLYKGEYINQLADKVELNRSKDLELLGQKVAEVVINECIKPTIENLNINFDSWVKEDFLYEKGFVNKAIEELEKRDLIYKREGASWFKSTKFGDEKDRVVVRKNSEPTYFASDIGYAWDKFKERDFDKVVNLWGADHYGYVDRYKGMLEAFGWADRWQPIVFQLVRLKKEGKPIRMSKRKGQYVLISDLLKEISLDVAKFVFLSKDFNTPLDIDLAKLKREDKTNPVYYIQYAFARINSIEKKKGEITARSVEKNKKEEFRYTDEERELILSLSQFVPTVKGVADNLDVHHLAYYANDLAKKFHKFYKKCPVLKSDSTTRRKRLELITSTKKILKQSLKLMGISQPEKM